MEEIKGKPLADCAWHELMEECKRQKINFVGKSKDQVRAILAKHEPKTIVDAQANGKQIKNVEIKKALKKTAKKTFDAVEKETKKAIKEIKDGKSKSSAKEIIELYLKGKTAKEIKIELGIEAGHYVNDVIWRHNNPSKKKGEKK